IALLPDAARRVRRGRRALRLPRGIDGAAGLAQLAPVGAAPHRLVTPRGPPPGGTVARDRGRARGLTGREGSEARATEIGAVEMAAGRAIACDQLVEAPGDPVTELAILLRHVALA